MTKPSPLLIHIFEDNPHHYVSMREFFVQQVKPKAHQQFWVRIPAKPLAEVNDYVTYDGPSDLMRKLNALPEHAVILFHGLFDLFNIATRVFCSRIASRCSCVIWGAELYRHQDAKSFKSRVTKWFHARLLSKFKRVYCLTLGDAELTLDLLQRRALVLPYPLVSSEFKPPQSGCLSPGPIKILLGNSATESNRHLELIDQLKGLAVCDVQLILPLSYGGSASYVDRVISYARTVFGEKCLCITDMLSKLEYDRLVSDIHMVVLGHKRQQGLYLVYAMLQMGKAIFVRSDTSTYESLLAKGFNVGDTLQLDKLSETDILALTARPDNNNVSLFDLHFSQRALAKSWLQQLDGLSERL